MEVTHFTYTLEIEDWLAFNAYHARHLPSVRRSRRLLRILFPVLFLLLALLSLFSGDWRTAVFTAVLAFTWFFGLHSLLAWITRQRLQKIIAGAKNSWVGGYEVSISPEALFSKNRAGEGKYYWHGMEQVVITDGFIYVYVTPLSALIIPKRTYNGSLSFVALADQMQSYFQAVG